MQRNHYGYFLEQLQSFPLFFRQPATATAMLQGSADYPAIAGETGFYQTAIGVLISVQVIGLPASDIACRERFFGFHIHSGETCSGDAQDPFANTGAHYNPGHCNHPYHAGDLPPIQGNHGYAFQIFLTDRFSVDEIIGKTVVIHLNRDDFTTQPAGDAGTKIACGVIMRTARR